MQRLIAAKTPAQVKASFALWTRKAVRQLIEVRYGITMPVRTIGHHLKRWGFTPSRLLVKVSDSGRSSFRHAVADFAIAGLASFAVPAKGQLAVPWG
jgi:transposase